MFLNPTVFNGWHTIARDVEAGRRDAVAAAAVANFCANRSDTPLASGGSRAYSRCHGHAGRPVVLIAWIECEVCGQIEKSPYEFNYPADMAVDTHLWERLPCEQCGRLAKLHLKRELKPLQ
jgi:hypothetical protein